MAYTTINKSSDYFNTKLWTGNAGTQTITGVGHQPDFTWVKGRNAGGESHRLTDVIRGVGYNLKTNGNSAQFSVSNGIQSWNSDGFIIGADDAFNKNTKNFVSWNWKANGAGSANTDGSISSTVSANTTAGFSIATWTTPSSGTQFTIGHGLGQAPDMMIMKCTTQANSWFTYHKGLGGNVNDYLVLNETAAEASQTNMWGANGAETNTMGFKAGTSSYTSQPMVGYFFSEKVGYSKIGSYVGNGNADGTFVYLGFSPAFLMVKRTNSTGVWGMYDSKRIGYNTSQGVQNVLRANSSDAVATGGGDAGGFGGIDFLSNGFKCKLSDANMGASGSSYIYMAFAENPFVTGDSATPTTAR